MDRRKQEAMSSGEGSSAMAAASTSVIQWEITCVNAWRIDKDETWGETPSVCQLNSSDLKETSGLGIERNSSINKTVKKMCHCREHPFSCILITF